MKKSSWSKPDVIIAGGGVIGLSLSWRLAQRGANVLLLDRQEPGKEASDVAAGMLLPYGESLDDDAYFKLCLESSLRYPSFVRELENLTGIKTDYAREGVLYTAWSLVHRKELARRLQWQERYGLKVAGIRAARLSRVYPGFSDGFVAAYLVHNDHAVDNRRLVAALLAASRKQGVRILPYTEVKRLILNKSAVQGVETNKGRFLAPWVVNAAGAWAGQRPFLFPGLNLPVKPVRGQRVVVEPSSKVPVILPRSVVFSEGCYLVPRKNKTVIVGSTEDEAGFEKGVTPTGLLAFLHEAARTFPVLSRYKISFLESGFRPAAPDRQPVLGETAVKGYVLATGHFRKGILLTPVTADEISRLVLTRRVSDLIRPFTVSRFSGKIR